MRSEIKTPMLEKCLPAAPLATRDGGYSHSFLTKVYSFKKCNYPRQARIVALFSAFSVMRLFVLLLAFLPSFFSMQASAATVVFNSAGGVDAKGVDGPMFTLDTQSSQLQVKWKGIDRFQTTGNGVYISAPSPKPGSSAMYGNSYPGQAFNTANTSPASLSVASDGVEQSAMQTFTTNEGLELKINWKYTRPNNYITADVELTIPDTYTIYDPATQSSHTPGNPGDNVWQGYGALNYSHTLNFVDYGCYASFMDNAKPHVGFYKNVSGAACAGISSMPGAGSEIIALRHNSGALIPKRSVVAFNENVLPNFQNNETLMNAVSGTTENRSIAAFTYVIASTGVKKFSYDIVLSTSQTIDHIELRHKGEASEYCGLDVTVLACQTSTVPCPEADLYTDQVVTGTLASNVTPSSFTLAPGGKSVTRIWKNQSDSPQQITATVTSTLKPKTTQCWNTVTQSASCDVLFTSKPCASFECMVSGAQAYANLQTMPTARNPLYTQLVGETFSVDVIALNSDGSVKEDYVTPPDTGTDTVLLFSDTRLPMNKICPTTAQTAIQLPATSSLNFTATDKGKKTVSGITIPKVYGKVSCQVISTNTALVDANWNTPLPPKTFCSSDSFTVRPKELTVSSALADDPAGRKAYDPDGNDQDTNRAGRPFSVSAKGGLNYTGRPTVDTNMIQWNDATGTPPSGRPSTYGRATPGVGKLEKVNVDASNVIIPPAESGKVVFQHEGAVDYYGKEVPASGNFTYDEVGYFQFLPYSVYDDTYADLSQDATNNDCVKVDDERFSNTRNADGKFGCFFGDSKLSDHIGRFTVNHFRTDVEQGCRTNVDPAKHFTYFRQPFKITVTALNFAGQPTKNFAENFAVGQKKTNLALNLVTTSGRGQIWGAMYPSTLAPESFKQGVATTGKDRDGNLTNLALVTFAVVPPSLTVNTPEQGTDNPRTPLVRASLKTGGNDLSSSPESYDTNGKGVYSQVNQAEGALTLRKGRTRIIPYAYGSLTTDTKLLFVAEYMETGNWKVSKDDDCIGNTAYNVTGNIPLVTTALPPNEGSFMPTITSSSNAVKVTITPVSGPNITTHVLDTGSPGLSGAGVLETNEQKRFKLATPLKGSFAGDFNLWLKAPGARGTVRVKIDVPDWLPLWTTGLAYPDWTKEPESIVAFGNNQTKWIYRREVY